MALSLCRFYAFKYVRYMKRARVLLAGLCCVVLVSTAACGNEDEEAGAAGELCLERRCKPGLYCASGGEMVNRCTADCDDTAFCQSHFGENTRCYSSQFCAKTCSGNGDCQGNPCVDLTSGVGVCVTQPS